MPHTGEIAGIPAGIGRLGGREREHLAGAPGAAGGRSRRTEVNQSVRCAKPGHRGWDEEAADQGGADEDGGGQSDAQLFGAEICPKREPEEMRSSPAWRQR